MTRMGGLAAETQKGGRLRPLSFYCRMVIGLAEWSGKLISAATLSVLFGALLINVILRYCWGTGLPWAYEIHAVLLPWLVAGGIIIASARARNIAITLLPDMAGQSFRKASLLFVSSAIIVISVAVLWSSQPILRASSFQTLSTLGIKQIWGYSSMIYAFAGMALISALEIVQILSGQAELDTDPTHSSLS